MESILLRTSTSLDMRYTLPMFNERKAAQVAAFFAAQAGRQVAVLKLMKLMYLADREALDQYGFPISGDNPVSMPHGPVLSMTYALISEGGEQVPGGWEEWIADKENHEVRLNRDFSRADLDELSDAELDVMQTVWQRFGKMGKWEIRDYTHDHCSEWVDPNGSSRPISFTDIFKALGRPPEVAQALAEQLCSERSIDKFLTSL